MSARLPDDRGALLLGLELLQVEHGERLFDELQVLLDALGARGAHLCPIQCHTVSGDLGAEQWPVGYGVSL